METQLPPVTCSIYCVSSSCTLRFLVPPYYSEKSNFTSQEAMLKTETLMHYSKSLNQLESHWPQTGHPYTHSVWRGCTIFDFILNHRDQLFRLGISAWLDSLLCCCPSSTNSVAWSVQSLRLQLSQSSNFCFLFEVGWFVLFLFDHIHATKQIESGF